MVNLYNLVKHSKHIRDRYLTLICINWHSFFSHTSRHQTKSPFCYNTDINILWYIHAENNEKLFVWVYNLQILLFSLSIHIYSLECTYYIECSMKWKIAVICMSLFFSFHSHILRVWIFVWTRTDDTRNKLHEAFNFQSITNLFSVFV